jgi:hypothetical protein
MYIAQAEFELGPMDARTFRRVAAWASTGTLSIEYMPGWLTAKSSCAKLCMCGSSRALAPGVVVPAGSVVEGCVEEASS